MAKGTRASKPCPVHSTGWVRVIRWSEYVEQLERDKQVRFTTLMHHVYNIDHPPEACASAAAQDCGGESVRAGCRSVERRGSSES